jgi:hypothetical protein
MQCTCEVKDSKSNSSMSCGRFTGFLSALFFGQGGANPFCTRGPVTITCGRFARNQHFPSQLMRLCLMQGSIQFNKMNEPGATVSSPFKSTQRVAGPRRTRTHSTSLAGGGTRSSIPASASASPASSSSLSKPDLE